LVSRLELRSAAAGGRPAFDGPSFAVPAEVEYKGIAEPLTAAIDYPAQRADLQRFGQENIWALAQAPTIAHPSKSAWPLSVDLRLIITTLLPRSL
jgi:hypothetical protein